MVAFDATAIMHACLLAVWVTPIWHSTRARRTRSCRMGATRDSQATTPASARHWQPSRESDDVLREAQAFYDQGLNYFASYVWIEAARSFTKRCDWIRPYLRLCRTMRCLCAIARRACCASGDRESAVPFQPDNRSRTQRMEIRARLVDSSKTSRTSTNSLPTVKPFTTL